MKSAGSAILLALLVQDPACDHGNRGACRPVDLKAVALVHREAARVFDSFAFDRPGPTARQGFDSGLPYCRARGTRRIRVETLPPEIQPLYFAPAGSATPPGAILVVTRARSIADVSIPADPELAARFGVRCAPTHVRPVSSTEVDLAEGESP